MGKICVFQIQEQAKPVDIIEEKWYTNIVRE